MKNERRINPKPETLSFRLISGLECAALPDSHNSAFGVLADQPRHLRPAQARYFPDVPFHQTFVAPVQTGIALRAQRPLRPLIQFFSIWRFESDFFVAG